ncbi:biotin carboxylase N-terminal domain-containing protein [Kitasatospora sp. NPDC088134]|uniref:ATP-binding protein n=1 Tax=Kitasatospora sp. NPDC088134 TaxID=3364071 RepID=UPI00380997F0
MFDTVLVANRGEIALRVIRTLRRLGMRSVAVHSDADADAPHVRAADLAVRLGPTDRSDSSAAETYLRADLILDAARRTGAQAVHPGYGFLAENSAFAEACTQAGLVFIGPPPAAVDLMGDKINAKEAVRAAGVPVVPGSEDGSPSDEQLIEAAARIGYPVLLKPSAGGGGKGMRLVRDPAELPAELAAARRVARTAFGDDTLLLERWVDQPRHIEVQVLADTHGRTVHLGERECSLQRRHQKLIEEAPSVLLNPSTRAAMGAAAVRAAEACGYTGAGTVEFIVPGGKPAGPDGDDVLDFFFMEMNTRLQVEHPVTELAVSVDGPEGPRRLDLVEWQLRVAAGEALTFTQSDISFRGHAIEARICAEDPERDFLPTGGEVLLLDEPSGEGVRVDSGIAPGDRVGSLYDPMLAKVIAYGPDRPTALRRLRAALAETRILGVTTNTGYLRRLLAQPEVVSGRIDTGLVERSAQQDPSLLSSPYTRTESIDLLHFASALLRQLDLGRTDSDLPSAPSDRWTDPFSLPSGWRLGGEAAWTTHRLRLAGREPVTVSCRMITNGEFESAIGFSAGTTPEWEVRLDDGPARRARATREGDLLRLAVDGLQATFTVAAERTQDGVTHWLGIDGDAWAVHPFDVIAERTAASGAHHGTLTAPMPGTVTVVKVEPGERVRRGQALLVLEAMKMEHVISAPHDGTVDDLRVSAGTTVAMDEALVAVTPDDGEPVAESAEQPAEDAREMAR